MTSLVLAGARGSIGSWWSCPTRQVYLHTHVEPFAAAGTTGEFNPFHGTNRHQSLMPWTVQPKCSSTFKLINNGITKFQPDIVRWPLPEPSPGFRAPHFGPKGTPVLARPLAFLPGLRQSPGDKL